MRIAHNRIDLAGQKFGFLTVIKRAESRNEYGTKTGYWLCQCECGTFKEFPTSNLTSGNSKSCGCYKKTSEYSKNVSAGQIKHGHSVTDSPTYRSWKSMKNRCKGKYANRGIAVDPRWEDFQTFLSDMGERPEGCTLDRIDNTGPYSPDNCRWASPRVQCNNRSNNRMLTYDGRTQTMAQWAHEFGIKPSIFYSRVLVYGWDIDRARNP